MTIRDKMPTASSGPSLTRTTFTTKRAMDFCSERELVTQSGHAIHDWPLFVLKELVDNALDACEEACTAPEIKVVVGKDGIEVSDNGPGIPATTVKGVINFDVRISNREAYVAPDRGAQGNALKTIIAVPFVLSEDEHRGCVRITGRGVHHDIQMTVDPLRQKPVVSDDRTKIANKASSVHVHWPDSPRSKLRDAKARFLLIAEDFTFLNPHLTLTVQWFNEKHHHRFEATDQNWKKWTPRDPTCPHWYDVDHLERLITAYITHPHQRDRTVREFVKEFRGLSSSAKLKKVLDATGFARTKLLDWIDGDSGSVDRKAVSVLLEAMRLHSKAVKPALLGIIGEDHLKKRFAGLGCVMQSFNYRKVAKLGTDGSPSLIESAFAWCEKAEQRRLITGLNWSASIEDPFRRLTGAMGESLGAVLSDRYAGADQPIVLLMHVASPCVQWTDRAKSAVIV